MRLPKALLLFFILSFFCYASLTLAAYYEPCDCDGSYSCYSGNICRSCPKDKWKKVYQPWGCRVGYDRPCDYCEVCTVITPRVTCGFAECKSGNKCVLDLTNCAQHTQYENRSRRSLRPVIRGGRIAPGWPAVLATTVDHNKQGGWTRVHPLGIWRTSACGR